MINLGSEPGTKAYRLYDPVGKRIHVSGDVIFEELKGWPWQLHEEYNSGISGSYSVPDDFEANGEESSADGQENAGDTGGADPVTPEDSPVSNRSEVENSMLGQKHESARDHKK